MKKFVFAILTLILSLFLFTSFLFAQRLKTATNTNHKIASLQQPVDKNNQIAKLSSSLNQLYLMFKENKDYRQFANSVNLKLRDDLVIVTIIPQIRQTTDTIDESFLQSFGAIIEAKAKHSFRAAIPIAQLENIASRVNGIGRIERQIQPIPDDVISEGVALMNADSWQSEGYEGAGAKVAIIDGGFQKLDDAVANGDIPPDYIGVDFSGSGLQSETEHGTAVAEAIHDVAPGATLYLYHISDLTDFENAKDEAVSQGVHVINHSMSWFLQSYYDGTGPVNDIANDANANGITWCNSASNSAEDHYRDVFTPTADDFHDFTGSGVKINPMGPDPDHVWLFPRFTIIQAWLNWDDYPLTAQDYDFYLYKWNYSNSTWEEVSSSSDRQTGSESPTESVAHLNLEENARYALAVFKYSATENVDFTIFSKYGLSHHIVANSVTDPASAAGVITVGAIDRANYSDGPQESFSGQGPTNDGRPKPDVTAPDNCNSFTYGYWQGTSLSSPHTAGICALIKSRFPSYTNDQIKDYLFNNCTVDLGDPGRDNVYGWGKVVLPPPVDGTIGDVNSDQSANSTDALIILSCDVGLDVTSFCPMNCGDVNDDGLINSTDALIILSYDVSLEVPYPVGESGCYTTVTPCAGCNQDE